ncbi:MAG: SH3 domain-containing protein, partial [Synergistaceae bacterium]|nr:SH3 domain-containing protein [Synergistaceae bacterium]
MRKIFAFILALFMCNVLEASERFVTFPAIGTCTGTYVRYREDPDTESNIIGRLHKPQNVIVLGQTATDGQVWYEIEDPESDST